MSYVTTAQEIACHFSQDHARGLKVLDSFKNDVKPRVKSHFEHILNDCPENGPSLTKIINIDFFQNFNK